MVAQERMSRWKMGRRGSRLHDFLRGFRGISSPIEKLLQHLDLILGVFLLLGHLLFVALIQIVQVK